MPARLGRPKTPDVSVLRNRIWANAVLNTSGLAPNKIALVYPSTSGGRDSTLFNKTLEHGRPSPRLWLEDDTEGPAIELGRQYPGTLLWLIHPIWAVLTLNELPVIHRVYSYMHALQGTSAVALMEADTESGSFCRVQSDVTSELDTLLLEGSLNSLCIVLLLAQEAFVLCKSTDHGRIAEFADATIESWPCLSWMKQDLRTAFAQVVLEAIHNLAPALVPRAAEARKQCLEQALLMMEQESPTSEKVITLSELVSLD